MTGRRRGQGYLAHRTRLKDLTGLDLFATAKPGSHSWQGPVVMELEPATGVLRTLWLGWPEVLRTPWLGWPEAGLVEVVPVVGEGQGAEASQGRRAPGWAAERRNCSVAPERDSVEAELRRHLSALQPGRDSAEVVGRRSAAQIGQG